jgi:hypothetical protein
MTPPSGQERTAIAAGGCCGEHWSEQVPVTSDPVAEAAAEAVAGDQRPPGDIDALVADAHRVIRDLAMLAVKRATIESLADRQEEALGMLDRLGDLLAAIRRAAANLPQAERDRITAETLLEAGHPHLASHFASRRPMARHRAFSDGETPIGEEV